MGNFLFFWMVTVLLTSCKGLEETDENLDQFIDMSMEDVIRSYNYTLNLDAVTTKDGFIITMFRVRNSTALKPELLPILILHGLSGCANNWFLKGRASLPFVLADLGYDVFLPNVRGTFYGRKHVSLDYKSPKFWNFTWHEMGVYDIPACIDFALNETGHEKVAVIAHSEGSCYFFAMAADLPEYDRKVVLSIHMAPGVFFQKSRVDHFFPMSASQRMFERISKVVGYNFISSPNVNQMLAMLCRDKLLSIICKLGITTFFEDAEELEPEMFAYLVSKVPCGGTVLEGMHYVQNIHSGKFNHFDYGPKKNLLIYNSTKPPEYNLNNVKSKVVIMAGSDDWLSSVNDIKILASKLPNLVRMEMPYKTHMDYLIGRHAYRWVYVRIAKYLKRANLVEAKRKRLATKNNN